MAAIKFLFARGFSLEIEMPAGLSPSQRTHLEEVGR